MGSGSGRAELLHGRWMWAVCITMLVAVAVVGGLPLQGVDFNTCRSFIPHLRTEAERMSCCILDKPVVDFKFEKHLPMRVRKPAHKLRAKDIEKYKRAYEIMRSLPPEDPRSLHAQMNLHCSYCAPIYHHFNSQSNTSYDRMELFMVHRNWMVWPWHRWYLYFHERILGSLIGDDKFAIPYWAWDIQNDFPSANTIPEIFTDPTSPLYDVKRSRVHVRPFGVDLTRQDPETVHNKPSEVLKINNRYTMWRAMIADTVDPYAFYGGAFREGDSSLGRVAGKFEEPHTAVHQWTGDETEPNWPDMGTAEWGGGDPIFFAHHSQVDRLWDMWKGLGGRDIDEYDWLETSFHLYNEKGELVRVNIRDSLNLEKLRISYDHIPVDWLDFRPQSIRDTHPKYARRRGFLGNLWRRFNHLNPILDDVKSVVTMLARRVSVGTAEENSMTRDYPMQKNKKLLYAGGRKQVIGVQLRRPGMMAKRMLRRRKPSAILQEALVIKGVVTKPFHVDVGFNVFMDLPEAERTTPLSCVEALGDFYITSEGYGSMNTSTIENIVTHTFSHKMSFGPRYDILRINHYRSVAVNLVSTWNKRYRNQVAVELTELSIELQAIGG